ncbi:MAG: MerR family transcriptional regulator [Bacteroidales bacterium]|nr:MerR family transcriptional regulator [Bacteroidales bacterium]
MAQGTYLIKDLEKLTGIKAHTIRIWEKRYKVVRPKRTSTNIRYYCDNDLKRLLNISVLLKQGFKISQLSELSDEELGEKMMSLYYHPQAEEIRIDNLVTAMVDLDEPLFEKTINLSTLNLGFEHTVLKIIYPFLERIGILWLSGSINPAQEHFVTNLLRQKLLVAIDSLVVGPSRDSKRFILFLPENELHELGLLFYSYLVRKAGHRIIYLGQSVPYSNVLEVARFKDPDVLVTSLVAAMNVPDAEAYVRQLADDFPSKILYITGNQALQLTDPLPSNVIRINDPIHFKNLITPH